MDLLICSDISVEYSSCLVYKLLPPLPYKLLILFSKRAAYRDLEISLVLNQKVLNAKALRCYVRNRAFGLAGPDVARQDVVSSYT